MRDDHVTFGEPFAIVLAPGERHWAGDEFDLELMSAVRQAVADLEDHREHSEEVTAVGRGASGIALLLTFAAIFLNGKRIEENLDAWLRLGRRLRKVLVKLSGLGRTFVSESAAAVLAFDAVIELEGHATGFTLKSSSIVPVSPGDFPKNAGANFSIAPERYYIFQFLAGSGTTHIVCLRSTGEIEFHHVLRTGSEMEFFGFGDTLPRP